MYILGISAFYHDSAACLLKDGEIIGAAQEERFTRKKHDAGFPIHAILYCLNEAGIAGKDIDNVVFYEKPLPASLKRCQYGLKPNCFKNQRSSKS